MTEKEEIHISTREWYARARLVREAARAMASECALAGDHRAAKAFDLLDGGCTDAQLAKLGRLLK